jgi:KaiC/GvpD/RAD55 family RecA-like ATPase
LAEAAQRGDDLAAMTERLGVMLAPTDQRKADGVITFDQCVDEYLNAQDDAVIPTGFRLFDDATDGGLPVGELTGLCAPPGAGKSALALQLVIGAMIQDPSLRALWCLGEMTPRVLVRRAACVGTAILGRSPVKMRDAKRRTDEARGAAESMRQLLGGGRLSVLKPALTVERIEAAIRVTKPKIVVVDYLQLMTGAGHDRIGELEATVAQLTALANITDTAIVVVSAMPKEAIRSGGKIGTLGKGTGQIDYAMSFFFLGEPDDEARESGAPLFDVVWRGIKARNDDRISFTARFDGPRQFYSQPVDPDEAFANFGIGGDT